MKKNKFHINKLRLSIFYRRNVMLFVWIYLCFSVCFQVYSQQNKKLDSDEVKRIVYTFYEIKESKTDSSYLLIENKFDELETKVKASNDKSALVNFYKEKADFYYYENDHKKALKCINKGFEILKTYKDNRSLGLLYESLGLLHVDGVTNDESFKYTLKSGELLNKYGKITDKIDCNINIGMHYKSIKEWEKAIKYLLIAKNNIEKSTKDLAKKTYINLFISQCNFELNNIPEGIKYLDEVEKIKEKVINKNDYSFESQYHWVKGLKAMKLGDYKTTCDEFKTEKVFTSKLFRERNGYLNSYVRVRTNLALTEIENQKVKNERAINIQNLKYRNIILLLGFVIIGFLSLYYSIQLRSKKERLKINNDLRTSNQKLREINEEISKTQNAKKKFLDAITFELRAPLNSIKGYAFNANNIENRSKADDYKKAMAFSTEYLLSLINDMIDSNVVDNLSKMVLKSSPTNFNQLLSNIVNSYELNNDNKGKISFQVGQQIDNELNIDVFRFVQLFVNLNFIENSLKINSDSSILINANLESNSDKSQTIKFEINDTGIIFPEEDIKQIENYFNDIDNNVSEEFDSSHGFSVVKKLFELFNTKLELKSESEKGVLISFSINFEKVAKKVELKNNEVTSDLNKIKILLVEDNKINQLLTKKILQNNGFECDVANDGKEAVDKTIQNDYSLILMDIMMPIMDGFEASIEIEKIKPHIPIVALTAISEEINNEKFLECKIKKVLTKPVDVKLLCDTILSFINK